MVAAPGCSNVMSPVTVTVATAVFDEDHVAVAVTSWMVPFANVAFALSWLVCPTAGTVPSTAREDVEGAVEWLHAERREPAASSRRTDVTALFPITFSI